MKICVAGRLFSIGMLLLPVWSGIAIAEDAAIPYRYSDEWSVVSAPGPAGPYQPVNIDPRVPGTALPSIPAMDDGARVPAEAAAMPEPESQPQPQTQSRQQPDINADTLGSPPAAGIAGPATGRRQPPGAGMQAPVPGYYHRTIPPAPAYGYPPQAGYPGHGWSPGYMNKPYEGYYRTPEMMPREREIPPPPVYDEMQRRGSEYPRTR